MKGLGSGSGLGLGSSAGAGDGILIKSVSPDEKAYLHTLRVSSSASISYSESADTSSIFRHALSRPYDIFSSVKEFGLEEAWPGLWDVDNKQTFTIFFMAHPCIEHGILECNQACQNTEKLLGEWQTLWSCLSLASFSLASQYMSSGENSEPIREAINTWQDEFSLDNISDFDAVAVLNRTFTCAIASCTFGSLGICDDRLEQNATDFFSADSRDWSFLDGFSCLGVESKVNMDIAGPGVTMAYQIQSWLAVSTWLAMRIFTADTTLNNIHRLRRLVNHELGRDIKKSFGLIYPRISAFMGSIKDSNIAHATASLVADFHEAQCFFVTAISIAAIYANRTQSAGFAGAENWGELIRNQALIQIVGIVGVISVTLTQMTLHRLSMHSVYSMLCATLAVVLAVISTLQTRTFDATYVHEMFRADGHVLEECGGNPSLTAFCNPKGLYSSTKSPFVFATIISTLIGLGLLWCEKVALSFGRVREIWDPRSRTPRQRRVLFVARMSIATIFTGFQIVLALMFVSSFLNLKSFPYFAGSATWNIGQIIALLIWAPVLAKYLYTVFFGVEKGFAIRLSQAFTVLRRQPIDAPHSSEESENGPHDSRHQSQSDVDLQVVPLRGGTPQPL